MIDIALLALTTVVPFLKKGIETITSEAGKDLYTWISNRLTGRNKQKDLEDLKKNPNDQRLQGKVQATLDDILAENPQLVAELSKLIEAAKRESVVIATSKNVNTGNINANGNVIIGDSNNINSK